MESLRPVWLILLPLALLAAWLASAPGAALALTGAERKATNITAIDGASTTKAALVEIEMRGKIEERLGRGGLRNASLKVRLVPASGRATVIRETGPTNEQETKRRGTRGPSEIVRQGDTVLVLVRKLPSAAERVQVKISRGAKKLDKMKSPLRTPETEQELEQELELQVDAAIVRADRALEKVEDKVQRAKDRIAQAKADLKDAGNRKQRRAARTTLRKQKAKRANLKKKLPGLEARVELLGSWLKLVEDALRPLAMRECNDGVDNGDPEDSLVDFGVEGGDLGCLMRVDNDEDNSSMSLPCPPSGASRSTRATITTPQSNLIERFMVAQLGGPLGYQWIIDAPVAGSSGGPYPVNTQRATLCGHGVNETYSWRVYTDGTPFGLPDAPAGEYALTVTVAAQNPAGSGTSGGGSLSLVLAAGTVKR